MDSTELAEAMTELGFDPHTLAGQEAFGALFGTEAEGYSVRTVRKWIQAERGVPAGVATVVILMLERGISPAIVERAQESYGRRHMHRRRHRHEARAYA